MQKLLVFFVLFTLFLGGFYFSNSFINKPQAQKRTVIQAKPIPTVPANTPVEDSIKAYSQRFFNETLLPSKFNGGMLIAKNNKILFESYNGLELLDSGKTIDANTSFHIASTSKTFTAVAILKLFDSLALSLDLPVSNFLDSFPSTKVTIRQLLNHRSGLPNYVYFIEKAGWSDKKNLTNKDLLGVLIKKWRTLKVGIPDTYFEYSNTNFALLALVIEKITKQSFSTYINNSIFQKLGMNNSFVFSIERSAGVLPSYKLKGEKEPFMFLDEVYGDKNIYSSTRDLLKWDKALYDTNYFPVKLREQAFMGYSREKKGIKNYGLGWRLFELASGKKIVYHNGWWHGNNAVFIRLPQDEVVIIVLGNRYNQDIYNAIQIANSIEGYGTVKEENK